MFKSSQPLSLELDLTKIQAAIVPPATDVELEKEIKRFLTRYSADVSSFFIQPSTKSLGDVAESISDDSDFSMSALELLVSSMIAMTSFDFLVKYGFVIESRVYSEKNLKHMHLLIPLTENAFKILSLVPTQIRGEISDMCAEAFAKTKNLFRDVHISGHYSDVKFANEAIYDVYMKYIDFAFSKVQNLFSVGKINEAFSTLCTLLCLSSAFERYTTENYIKTYQDKYDDISERNLREAFMEAFDFIYRNLAPTGTGWDSAVVRKLDSILYVYIEYYNYKPLDKTTFQKMLRRHGTLKIKRAPASGSDSDI